MLWELWQQALGFLNKIYLINPKLLKTGLLSKYVCCNIITLVDLIKILNSQIR